MSNLEKINVSEVCASIANGNRNENFKMLVRVPKKDLVSFLLSVEINQDKLPVTTKQILLGLTHHGYEYWTTPNQQQLDLKGGK